MISACEIKYLKNKRTISELQEKLAAIIYSKFESGTVNRIPAIIGKDYKLPGGVSIRLIYLDKVFDVYMFKGSKHILDWHVHTQEQVVKVLCGQLTVSLDDEIRVIRPGEQMTIKPNVHRRFDLVDGTKFLSIFRPPISSDPKNED